jgi:metal-responsive CopG/Arc/MetJ family transcriptional regulator
VVGKNKRNINITISKKLLEILDIEAKANELSRSQQISYILNHYLSKDYKINSNNSEFKIEISD